MIWTILNLFNIKAGITTATNDSPQVIQHLIQKIRPPSSGTQHLRLLTRAKVLLLVALVIFIVIYIAPIIYCYLYCSHIFIAPLLLVIFIAPLLLVIFIAPIATFNDMNIVNRKLIRLFNQELTQILLYSSIRYSLMLNWLLFNTKLFFRAVIFSLICQ